MQGIVGAKNKVDTFHEYKQFVTSITTVPQSYPVCPGALPAPEPSRLYEAPDRKHSQNHRTLSDRETGSRAPGGHTYKAEILFFCFFGASFHTFINNCSSHSNIRFSSLEAQND